MKFAPANRDDINKYYRNCYVKFKEFGDLLFFIKEVSAAKVMGQVEDGREFHLHISQEHPYDVEFILPRKSFFQYNGRAMLLQRHPARQYHRGICGENTSINFKAPGANGQIHGHGMDFSVLRAYVNKPQFPKLSDAIRMEDESVALDRRMMYMRSTHQIHVDFVPVARVNVKASTIRMLCPIFQEDVEDLLRNNEEAEKFQFVTKD
jgi:hypothetical protein